MKTFTTTLALAALALTAIGCDTPTAPADPVGAASKAVAPRIDQNIRLVDIADKERVDPAIALTSPSLDIAAKRSGGYDFIFNASAGGSSSSASMAALRSLRSVTFGVYSATGRLLDSRATTDIPASGVMNSVTHEASLIASASVEWRGDAGVGGYVVMTVRSDKGIYSKQQNFPAVYYGTHKTLDVVRGPVAIERVDGWSHTANRTATRASELMKTTRQ